MRKRKRHQAGTVTIQRGRWRGHWYENGTKKSRTFDFVKKMTKSAAQKAVAKIIADLREAQEQSLFGAFVEGVYFAFYTRKWKSSTRAENVQRVRYHLISRYGDWELSSFKRDELQDLLDEKAHAGLSFSVVDHLRWDLKAIFDLALAEGKLSRNPALMLFTPKEAKKPVRRVMDIANVQQCFTVLEQRERLIAKLAVLAGMRPGEIFALTWGRLTATYADIQQRVYRGVIDSPKTDQSIRKAALSVGLLRDIEAWKEFAFSLSDESWVFPSERLYERKSPKAPTPLRKDNCWRRNMQPKLAAAGLGWVNFQVFRRTHASLMKQLDADPKLVADQLGHTVDVNLNVYTQSSVEKRLALVNELEAHVGAKQCSNSPQEGGGARNLLN